MKDGLIFIWVEKELVHDVIKFMEDQAFFYVENVCYVMLDQTQKAGKLRPRLGKVKLFIVLIFENVAVDGTRRIDISSSYVSEPYQYLRKSKKTLLIFRRTSDKKAKCTLELRH